jgi:hypothetical protein
VIDIAVDIETYPNVFTLAAMPVDRSWEKVFEISDYRNETQDLLEFLNWMRDHRMVGFNNLGFDYPVIHMLMQMRSAAPQQLYDKAMAIINSEDKWLHQVYPNDRFITQIDLYKIHHFDNRARATSLKAIEFAMGMDNIKDLPFPVATHLTPEQITVLKEYNLHDVEATVAFYHHTLPMIEFREELSIKYDRDFMNHNDTKIGKDYFTMRLQQAGVQCYEYGPDGRRPKQTKRPHIVLRDAILPDIKFHSADLQRVLDWLKQQTITETKGVFKDLTATVNGFEFVFGLGGIHGSVESEVIESTDDRVVLDLDVTSYYPSLAIANRFYPKHLGTTFCDVYADLKDQRVHYPKGTPENAMLKLALNGVYGDSNNPYSIFYDPMFTMRITLNGQLLLCVLSEWLMQVESLRLIQCNTDGVSIVVDRDKVNRVEFVCQVWEEQFKLSLESAVYDRMFIRDVNNYLAVYADGRIKTKGAYDYNRGWHQDQSALIVPKVAVAALTNGWGIRETIEQWPAVDDFMLRAKVPRNSSLVLQTEEGERPLERITRYLVTKEGGRLVKIMPPLKKKPDQWRRIGIASGWNVTPCNDIREADDAVVDLDYYVQEVEKLVLGLT